MDGCYILIKDKKPRQCSGLFVINLDMVPIT